MELHLNDNEKEFVNAVERVVRDYLDTPREHGISIPAHSSWSDGLDRALRDAGLLEVAREPEFGPVCPVLMIEQAARSPLTAEIGASSLIAPLACEASIDGPIAVCRADDVARPIRYLPVAKTLLVLRNTELLALEIDPSNVTVNKGVYAYPFGTFTIKPDLSAARRVGEAAKALLYWQVAIAAEGAALMQAAMNYTVDYVKNRRQFGRPIGSFQAVKHRLSASATLVRGATWLARRAAWSGTAQDAAMAALYAQQAIPEVTYDCHQFNGAMGMTLECPLHFWTHRLKALQGELGGVAFQSQQLVGVCWTSAKATSAPSPTRHTRLSA
jgi:alkylation response protein AidB-like acyl-CoA dehydrogenase